MTDPDHIALLTSTITEYRAAIDAFRALKDKHREHKEAGNQIQHDIDRARWAVDSIWKEIALLSTGMTMQSFIELFA